MCGFPAIGQAIGGKRGLLTGLATAVGGIGPGLIVNQLAKKKKPVVSPGAADILANNPGMKLKKAEATASVVAQRNAAAQMGG